MSNIDRAAEVIERTKWEHRAKILRDGGTLKDATAEEFARALADTRLLRPDLPKPDSGGIWEGKWGVWVVSPLQGGVCAHVDGDLTPDEARDLADALYAAANHSEKEGTDGQDN